MVFMWYTLIDAMGLICTRQQRSQADSEEHEQTDEIERRIDRETKAEKHIQKLLLLGIHTGKLVIDSAICSLI